MKTWVSAGDEWYPMFTVYTEEEAKRGFCPTEMDVPAEELAFVLKAQEDFDKAQKLIDGWRAATNPPNSSAPPESAASAQTPAAPSET